MKNALLEGVYLLLCILFLVCGVCLIGWPLVLAGEMQARDVSGFYIASNLIGMVAMLILFPAAARFLDSLPARWGLK